MELERVILRLFGHGLGRVLAGYSVMRTQVERPQDIDGYLAVESEAIKSNCGNGGTALVENCLLLQKEKRNWSTFMDAKTGEVRQRASGHLARPSRSWNSGEEERDVLQQPLRDSEGAGWYL